ncbi:MAG: response regulator transcription factor [Anaerolineales bacterium]|nr:response regulator transcription factor [Anaerolineales bacterium]
MILVVDDDDVFRGSIADLLADENYSVLEASSATEALDLLQQYNPQIEVVFSDVKMPHMDGLELLHRIKIHYPMVIVVMLTGHGEVNSAVQAMREGALNYLLKPANRQQILASTEEAFATRASTIQKQNLMDQVVMGLQQLGMVKPELSEPNIMVSEQRFVQVRDLLIDQYRLTATLKDVKLDLTPTEFDLLSYLALAHGRVVAFEELVYRLQGIQAPRDEARSMLSTHLSNLRAKLREAGGEDYIVNSRGHGYFLNIEL